MKSLSRLMAIACLILSINAWAGEAQPMQANVVVEAQVQRLSAELRCLVCQNQTLADSHSELAEDLRQEIREMAMKGMTDQEITDYLVARYGDFVRYRPPLKATTLLLWFGPFALLIFGTLGLWLMLRRRAKMTMGKPLSAGETQKVSELLNKES